MTVEDLRKIKKQLEQLALKPYKGFIGMGREGFFEIKDEAGFQKLRENTRRAG